MKVCPMCDSSNYKIVMKFDQIWKQHTACELVVCGHCRHFFSLISEDINVQKLYSGGQYTVLDSRNSLFDKLFSIDDMRIIRQLSKLVLLEKKILDFGCGKGRFLHAARTQGWKTKGIETATARAEFGINEYQLDISMYNYDSGLIADGPFNVITIFHVIEHLTNPKKLLGNLIKDNLEKNGLLVIEVPLFGSLQAKIAKKQWIHLDPPRHISHFTKSNLTKLINDLGLQPIRYEYCSIHNGILGMVQSIMSFFGYRKNIIFELKFNRTIPLMLLLIAVIPVASLLELAAVFFKNGGIVRVYCRRITTDKL